MKYKERIILIVFFGFIFFIIFKNWFIQQEIIGGDWPFFFKEELLSTTLIPPSWNTVLINGLGGISPLYSLHAFQNFTISVSNIFHFPWNIVYKITWFGSFIFFSIFSSLFLAKTILSKFDMWQGLICSIIFTMNSYILMVIGGGQMGVALAYSLSPLVIAVFIKLIKLLRGSLFRQSLIAALALSVQVMFDPRIAYITGIAIGLYGIFSLKRNIYHIFSLFLYALAIPITTVILLHMFWILPTILFRYNPISILGKAYSAAGSFIFFSFADFSHAFSLLHPNWPENIFGKTYFLRPEFLLLPILAFSSLLFIKDKKNISYFVVLGLLGAFLAKGANEPVGAVNIWMFEHVPGFILFRDPTKFYLLIALSYSILIPFSIKEISRKVPYFSYQAISVAFVLLFLFQIRQAIFGKLSGTFVPHTVPSEYFTLEKFLGSQPEFFRTLWVPRQQRFSFASDTHPAVEAEPLFQATSSAQVIRELADPRSISRLQNLGIHNVIVPYDNLGEIFLKDRKYNDKEYLWVINNLQKISWLHELPGFGKLAVFELTGSKSHFWLVDGKIVKQVMVSPDEYSLEVIAQKPSQMNFVENYSPFWVAKIGGTIVHSLKTNDGLNSFFLKKKGAYHVIVYFLEKKWFIVGWIISGLTFCSIVIFNVFTFISDLL